MKKLFMKIKAYDEDSQSLLVSFASDKTKSQNPNDYPAYAYQPASMYPGINDVNQIKKMIAVNGKYLAEQQAIKEQLKDDPVRNEQFKSMVDSLTEYDIQGDPYFNPQG